MWISDAHEADTASWKVHLEMRTTLDLGGPVLMDLVLCPTIFGRSSNWENFHDLVAEVVNDLNSDATGGGFWEWTRDGAVERIPGFAIYFRFQGGFERLIRVVCAEEVGVADEEAFFVVIGINEPAGDTFRAGADDLPRLGFEHVNALNVDADLVFADRFNIDVGLAKDDEEVAGAGVLQLVGHVEVGVHPGFEHRNAAELFKFGRVGVVVERARDEDIEGCGQRRRDRVERRYRTPGRPE